MATDPGITPPVDPPGRSTLEAELLALEVLSPGDRVDATEPGAVLEEQARRAGHVDLVMRARLVQAVARGRAGHMASCSRTVREINRWALEHRHPYLLARTHRHLSFVTRLMGEYGISLEHAVRACELDDATTPPLITLDHQHVLSIALARSGHWDAAEARFASLHTRAAALGQVGLQVLMLNNLAYLNSIAGRLEQARVAADRMVAVAARHGLRLMPAWVDTYARIALEAGQAQRAVDFIEDYFAEDCADVVGVADCYLTLAEGQRQTGLITRAHSTLQRCEQIARHQNLMEIQTRVLRERAELFAAQGRYREAFEEHKRFSSAAAVLQDEQQDGRAKVAAAVFETAEARREIERFRRLSQLDPLTGLRNRRYVDDHLPGIIAGCHEHDLPVTAALLDLDHFKLVNDRFSHEVGDQVLTEVARLLRETVDGVGFAARLGGEEFLLVLPGVERSAALVTCVDLRGRMREHPWDRLHPDLTSVTASVGIGCTDGMTRPDQARLLREADTNLYRAKRSGRDRVLVGPDHLQTGSGDAEVHVLRP